jgi:hypothetical protein
MKNKCLVVGAVVAFVAFTATVQAIPITGSINFQGGTATLNSPSVTTATAITAFGGAPTVATALGVAPTGSFTGTGGTAVTFVPTGFTFSPGLSPNPVNPLWSFVFGGNTYSFSLSSVTSSVGVGPSLNLAGAGTLSISGGVFTPTAATWTFSTTGTGPDTFGFVAGNTSVPTVPDGGMTVILLGIALSGLCLFRKKMMA